MAIRIDASGDSLTRTTNLPTNNGYTAMAWVCLNTNRDSVVFSYGPDTSVQKALQYNSGFGLWDGTNFTAMTTVLQVGLWTHAAVTYDGTNMRGYVNGVLEATGPSQTNLPTTTIYVGTSASTQWFNGAMAHLRIYNAVLSQAEINTERFSVQPVRLSRLNSWFPLNNPATAAFEAGGNGNGRREYNLTVAGTLTLESGPVIVKPRRFLPIGKRASGAATAFPWMYYAQQQALLHGGN